MKLTKIKDAELFGLIFVLEIRNSFFLHKEHKIEIKARKLVALCVSLATAREASGSVRAPNLEISLMADKIKYCQSTSYQIVQNRGRDCFLVWNDDLCPTGIIKAKSQY